MPMRRWLQNVLLLALKKAWQRSREVSREKAKARVFQKNDLINPQHPFNVSRREIENYNARRTREALHNYLQDCQRFEEHQRHERNYWDYYHR